MFSTLSRAWKVLGTRLACLLAAVLCAACASDEPRFLFRSPPSGQASICIYKVVKDPFARAPSPVVQVNGRPTWPLSTGKYLQEVVRPGQVTLLLEKYQPEGYPLDWRASTDAKVELIAQPDMIYYVELSLDRDKFSFQQVGVTIATQALKSQRPGN